MAWRLSFKIVIFLLSSTIFSTAQPSSDCPFSPWPVPSGKYSVGTIILPVQRLHGTGSSRRVQLWYPAQPSSGHAPAGYVADKETLAVFRSEKFLEQPECVLDHWSQPQTS